MNKTNLTNKVYTICTKGARKGKRVLVGESNTPYSPMKLATLRRGLIQESLEFGEDIKLEVIQ